MSITHTTSEDKQTVTITVSGRFDFSTHQEFVQVYKSYEKGEKSFVVDLNGAEYMDSSALGMLLQLREYNRKGDTVVLLNANDAVKDVLNIANFNKLFSVQ